jgi:hypothetical protein
LSGSRGRYLRQRRCSPVHGDGSVISMHPNPGGSAIHNAPVIRNLHTSRLSGGCAHDVFGSNWRQSESLQPKAAAQRYRVEAAHLPLAFAVRAVDNVQRSTAVAHRDVIRKHPMSVDTTRSAPN